MGSKTADGRAQKANHMAATLVFLEYANDIGSIMTTSLQRMKHGLGLRKNQFLIDKFCFIDYR